MSEAVERVRQALTSHGHADTIVAFPEGTRTAAAAAAAIGCTVGQIAKSIVFRSGTQAVVVITSGSNRVDKRLAGLAAGLALVPAGPEFVLEATGFAAGGVSPIGLRGEPVVVMDRDLLALDPIWAAAGSPTHVFQTRADSILAMTGATVADVKTEPVLAAG